VACYVDGVGSSGEIWGRHEVDGMDDFVSTREVARIAGVGPSAVKRWADSGRLRCARTAGGHRRFARAEVEEFLRRHGDAGRARRDPWIEGLLGARDPLGLEALLLAERARRGAWHRVAEAAGAALATLGTLWREGEVSVVEEHLASERLARALARVGESIPLDGGAPWALLACAEGDDHTLGLALVELVLREAGWATLWAGRRTPTAELTSMVKRGEVQLLAVSASEASADAVGLRREAEELGRACRVAGVRLVLGGNGAWPDRPRHGLRLRALEPLHRWAVAERERLLGPRPA
jgi:excisionase family DNA binding protein